MAAAVRRKDEERALETQGTLLSAAVLIHTKLKHFAELRRCRPVGLRTA
jgi:hypothetical protein